MSAQFTDAQTTQLAEMVAAAVFAAMSAVEAAGEAPAKEAADTHRNAAGRLVDTNGRFVKDPAGKAAAKKAPAARKTAKKATKKRAG